MKKRKSKISSPIVFVALLICGLASQASADIIILDTPSFVQPEENLLLQGTGLATTGNPVQGMTNQTGTIFNIWGSEDLTLPSRGQATVEALEGTYEWVLFDAFDPLVFFTLFEANVNVTGTPLITVGATEFNDGPTTFYSYIGSSGQNFFGVEASNNQFIDYIMISTEPDEAIEDIRQIRVGGITGGNTGASGGPISAPEPTSLLLMGTGIGIIGLMAKRRKR